jgi:hypothetical protein
MFALVQTEELEKLGQVALQPMKNRYRKKNSFQQELLGIDTTRMKLYDLSGAALAAAAVSSPPSSGGSSKPGGPVFSRKRRPLANLKKDAEE